MLKDQASSQSDRMRAEEIPAGDTASKVDMRAILTTKLHRAVHDRQYPWPKNCPLNWGTLSRWMFGDLDSNDGWKELWYDNVLVPVSRIGIDDLPTNMLQFLPAPAADDFPILCLGLIMLFDQGPTHVLSSIDARYTDGYFRPLALRLVHQCLQLPLHLHPWTWERWHGLGWNFEHWVVRQMLFFAPLTHSEDVDDQAIQHGMMEHMRCLTESRVGNVDPFRATAGADAHDLLLFARLIEEKVPTGPDVKMEDFVWFTVRVMYAHMPINRKFGRYPYRNVWKGTGVTDEERQFLEDRDWFGAPRLSEAEKTKLNEDLEEGRWMPLKPLK